MTTAVENGWILSPHRSSRLGERVRLVVIHDTEGMKTARTCAAYFGRADVRASSHVAIDDTEIVGIVGYDWAAWTLRNGNQESDNAELCGGAYAKWTREQWLQHPGMIRNTARWVVARCKARGIPLRRLSDAECRAAMLDDNHPGGVIDHWTYTRATGDGTHWDVGSNFPWDVMWQYVEEITRGVPPMKHVPVTTVPAALPVPAPIGAPDMVVTHGNDPDWKKNRVAILVGSRIVDITTDETARGALQSNIQAGAVIPIPLNASSWAQLMPSNPTAPTPAPATS